MFFLSHAQFTNSSLVEKFNLQKHLKSFVKNKELCLEVIYKLNKSGWFIDWVCSDCYKVLELFTFYSWISYTKGVCYTIIKGSVEKLVSKSRILKGFNNDFIFHVFLWIIFTPGFVSGCKVVGVYDDPGRPPPPA